MLHGFVFRVVVGSQIMVPPTELIYKTYYCNFFFFFLIFRNQTGNLLSIKNINLNEHKKKPTKQCLHVGLLTKPVPWTSFSVFCQSVCNLIIVEFYIKKKKKKNQSITPDLTIVT